MLWTWTRASIRPFAIIVTSLGTLREPAGLNTLIEDQQTIGETIRNRQLQLKLKAPTLTCLRRTAPGEEIIPTLGANDSITWQRVQTHLHLRDQNHINTNPQLHLQELNQYHPSAPINNTNTTHQ